MNKFYKAIMSVAIGIAILSSASSIFLFNKVKSLDSEIGILSNNNIALNQSDSLKDDYIRVLEIDMKDLKLYNNSLIKKIDSISNTNNINKNKLKYAAATISSLKDSLSAIPKYKYLNDSISSLTQNAISNKNLCDFDPITLTYNEYTKTIQRVEDGEFKQQLDISDMTVVFIEWDKIYRNKRKNFLSRLIHLDFKKDLIFKAKADNINKKIKLTETIVIKNSKE